MQRQTADIAVAHFAVLANPPFNDSDCFRKDDDVRWQFGVPPKGNANFAWVQLGKIVSTYHLWRGDVGVID